MYCGAASLALSRFLFNYFWNIQVLAVDLNGTRELAWLPFMKPCWVGAAVASQFRWLAGDLAL